MKRTPWSAEPSRVGEIPTMISREEQSYLHWLGRTQWRDQGHVVEIGPWLGGSTRCLAEGMLAGKPNARHRLHVFDNFLWREFMEKYAPLELAPGASFEPNFRANLAGHEERMVVHRCSLPDETIPGDAEAEGIRGREASELALFDWDTREPIEILFVDGAKSWRGMRWLLRRTADALAPGKSLVVAQDLKYWGAYWVPAMLARFLDSLELVHHTERGSTVTFRLVHALSVAQVEALVDDATALPARETLAGLERVAGLLEQAGDKVGAMHVRLSGVQLLLHLGRHKAAAELYEHLQQRWPVRGAKGQLRDARKRLAGLGLEVSEGSTLARFARAVTGSAATDLVAFAD
ncbi:MAG: hypothetical protein NTV21_11145 [Planctomycetota bacterium]|nr:hypothetical protein [Planctomycetota bacterium]